MPAMFGGMWRWRPDVSGWCAAPRAERREVGVFLHSWCLQKYLFSYFGLSRRCHRFVGYYKFLFLYIVL